MPSEEDLERTSEFWGSDSARWRSEQWVHWLQHPKVQERLNDLATGKPHKNRYANFVDRFFTDPSGSVLEHDRSADVVKFLPDYFDVLEINGYGGSLLHELLEGITGNFVEDNPRSMSYLQSFFDLEGRLIASGRPQHDFANIIARKKADAEQPLSGEDGHLTSVSQ